MTRPGLIVRRGFAEVPFAKCGRFVHPGPFLGDQMRILLLAPFAFSRSVRAITLDELLAKNLAARGGAENLRKRRCA